MKYLRAHAQADSAGNRADAGEGRTARPCAGGPRGPLARHARPVPRGPAVLLQRHGEGVPAHLGPVDAGGGAALRGAAAGLSLAARHRAQRRLLHRPPARVDGAAGARPPRGRLRRAVGLRRRRAVDQPRGGREAGGPAPRRRAARTLSRAGEVPRWGAPPAGFTPGEARVPRGRAARRGAHRGARARAGWKGRHAGTGARRPTAGRAGGTHPQGGGAGRRARPGARPGVAAPIAHGVPPAGGLAPAGWGAGPHCFEAPGADRNAARPARSLAGDPRSPRGGATRSPRRRPAEGPAQGVEEPPRCHLA